MPKPTLPTRPIAASIRFTPEVLTLKALRLLKRLSRKEAADLCGVTARAIEQLENGRNGLTEKRIERIVGSYGFSMGDYERIRADPGSMLKQVELEEARRQKPPAKLRRNYRRIITKEVRIIRILRRRRGLTQYQAAKRCGYVNSIFGQIENGRIELPRERIEHIVRRLGYSIDEFDEMMKAHILRDEMIQQCSSYLDGLEDHKLESAQTVIKALLK